MKRSYCSYTGDSDNCADGCDGCYYKIEEEVDDDDVNEQDELIMEQVDCKTMDDLSYSISCYDCSQFHSCFATE